MLADLIKYHQFSHLQIVTRGFQLFNQETLPFQYACEVNKNNHQFSHLQNVMKDVNVSTENISPPTKEKEN